MYENQVMASATLISMLCNTREDALVFQEELCDAGVRTAGREAGVLDKAG